MIAMEMDCVYKARNANVLMDGEEYHVQNVGYHIMYYQ